MTCSSECYWGTGLRACHCSRCHRSFSSLDAFDAHQPGTGKHCIDITELVHPATYKNGKPHPYAGLPVYQVVLRGGNELKDGSLSPTYEIYSRIAYEFMEVTA